MNVYIYLCGKLGSPFIGAVARAGLSATVTDNQQCGLPATVEQSQPGAVITFYCDSPVTAKYVSLDIDRSQPLAQNGELHVAEVTVNNAAGLGTRRTSVI